MKMTWITAIILFSTSAFAFETTPINLVDVADAQRLEIVVDTSSASYGQSMMVKVYTASRSQPVVAMFNVTTGRQERETPEYQGGVSAIEKLHYNNGAPIWNAIILENDKFIRQIKRPGVSSASAMLQNCVKNKKACSSGSIAMLERESNALFVLANLVGKDNIRVVVGEHIMAAALNDLKK